MTLARTTGLAALTLCAAVLLPGCRTVEGFGEDVQTLGGKMSHKARENRAQDEYEEWVEEGRPAYRENY
jgi:predicted small secreted protein